MSANVAVVVFGIVLTGGDFHTADVAHVVVIVRAVGDARRAGVAVVVIVGILWNSIPDSFVLLERESVGLLEFLPKE